MGLFKCVISRIITISIAPFSKVLRNRGMAALHDILHVTDGVMGLAQGEGRAIWNAVASRMSSNFWIQIARIRFLIDAYFGMSFGPRYPIILRNNFFAGWSQQSHVWTEMTASITVLSTQQVRPISFGVKLNRMFYFHTDCALGI